MPRKPDKKYISIWFTKKELLEIAKVRGLETRTTFIRTAVRAAVKKEVENEHD